MRKFKLKHYSKIHLGVFNYSVIFIVSDLQDAIKYVAWQNNEKAENIQGSLVNPKGLTFTKTGYTPIIWLPRIPKTPDEISTLSHEAFHATHFIMDWAGMNLCQDNAEAFAHTLTFIVRSFLQSFKR